MTDPALLRRAIESVGIEKPSDYTLVLEEVERLMDERLVEKVARAIHERRTHPEDNKHWFHVEAEHCALSHQLARSAIDASGLPALIRAATDLVKEAEEMGWDKRSETGLPGAWDKFKLELERVTK